MLATATVRTRWPSFVGAFVALSLGVALLTTTVLVLAGSRPQLPEAYAAAPVVVSRVDRASTPWSADEADELVRRLGAIPSVTAAVPDRSFYAQVVLDGRAQGDPTGGPYGHGWSTARLAGIELAAGRGPERDGEVVLGTAYGRWPGDRVSVLTATGPSDYTVTGVVTGTGIYTDDATARRLAGGVRVIGLLTGPDADVAPVAAAAASIVGGQAEVLTGAARTALEPARDRQIRADAGTFLSVMASLSAFVSIFVVASTFALGVAQRRREFGLLRTVGATPRQVRRTLFAEAFLVGALA
jgi:putative ABC transport system permease protein